MLQKICAFILFRLCGWEMIGQPPTAKQYLFVGVPHTSNWDFVYGWLAINALQLNVKIFVKDVFFIWPINYICQWIGVMPVNRRRSTNFVDSVAEMFEKYDSLAALITPEGTRSYRPVLKSGYYHLAIKAGIPIVVAGPNFKEKTFTILPARPPMATFEEDEANVIEFCRTQVGKRPKETFQ